MSRFIRGVAFLLATSAASLGAASANAATITVDTVYDWPNEGPPWGYCTLRSAIYESAGQHLNGSTCAGSGVNDTIVLPAGTIQFNPYWGVLDVYNSVTIVGAGAESTVLYPYSPTHGDDLAFEFYTGSYAIKQLSIYGAQARSPGILGSTIMMSSGATVLLDHVEITDNANETASAIYNDGGRLTIQYCTFEDNAGRVGGAVYTRSGSVTIKNSTFEGNSASDAGAAIFNYGGALTISNSTFAYNDAQSYGGAIYSVNGSLNLYSSSVVANLSVAGAAAGAGIFTASNRNRTESSIVANNHNGAASGSTVDDYVGSPHSAGGPAQPSYFTSGTAPASEIHVMPAGCQSHAAPMTQTCVGLMPMADNGGPTRTFAVTSTSPAYNAGVYSASYPRDQRSHTRPAGGPIDIGAYQH